MTVDILTPAHTSDADDFILSSSDNAVLESEGDSGLCCCQYIDKDNKNFHVLACCCNCEDFDLVCTRLITCKTNDWHNINNMLLTFQDRLRIPWRGGAIRIPPEVVIPGVIVPLTLALAAINGYTAIIMLLTNICFLGYGLQLVQRAAARTRFFLSWIVWSVVYLVVLFEFTVPLLELLPEENIILVILSTIAITCFWYTKQKAVLNHLIQSTAKDELPGITEASSAEEEAAAQTALLLEHEDDSVNLIGQQPNICDCCRKYMPARTVHCAVCGACILRRDHHSYWLNCCIGEWNHRYYLMGLLFAELALLLGANLTLTAVCHPFLVVRFLGVPVMLPDDCSEVFEDYELGIAFIIAAYALIIASYVLVVLLRQIYLISRGTTMQECQRGHCGNRKSIWLNWKTFVY